MYLFILFVYRFLYQFWFLFLSVYLFFTDFFSYIYLDFIAIDISFSLMIAYFTIFSSHDPYFAPILRVVNRFPHLVRTCLLMTSLSLSLCGDIGQQRVYKITLLGRR